MLLCMDEAGGTFYFDELLMRVDCLGVQSLLPVKSFFSNSIIDSFPFLTLLACSDGRGDACFITCLLSWMDSVGVTLSLTSLLLQ